MVGDDAFPLRQYMLKPYPHRHLARDERFFNYRCSRARRVVENAFGILANRFRRLLTTLEMRPSTVTKTVMACMTLHNLMRTRHPNIQNADLDREDEQGQFIPGAWRDQAVLEDVQAAGNGPYIYTSRDIRPGYGRVPAEHRPVSLTSMHGTPADTRPCTGRRVFRCGYDGAAMRELGESPNFDRQRVMGLSTHTGHPQHLTHLNGTSPAQPEAYPLGVPKSLAHPRAYKEEGRNSSQNMRKKLMMETYTNDDAKTNLKASILPSVSFPFHKKEATILPSVPFPFHKKEATILPSVPFPFHKKEATILPSVPFPFHKKEATILPRVPFPFHKKEATILPSVPFPFHNKDSIMLPSVVPSSLMYHLPFHMKEASILHDVSFPLRRKLPSSLMYHLPFNKKEASILPDVPWKSN
ncbi:hypothetical protein MAR_027960 [Mya arenaria]|uniref:DDE Tnp4 domain-containing protein n=1 Tax=Mya arenaria TaxID=6604 RepID=A0ABY7DJU4_MYAAR|nr:hypothetical protein MAR_027960 [Mya arenaria]